MPDADEPKPPKLFISYSWTTPEHESRVKKLAEDLVSSGVDVLLDKWALLHGNDTHAFMEQANDPSVDRVAMICDHRYVEKANKREGGVGIEAQIITPGVYQSHNQNKYVAIVMERDEDGKACLPTYYGSKKYIDFSDPSNEAAAYEELLRWSYNKPKDVKPPLGKRPAFLDEDDRTIRLATGPLQRAAVAAVKASRANAPALIRDYFDAFTAELEKFRVRLEHHDTDEKFMASIEAFIPYRDEMVDMFMAIASYADVEETSELVHRLFEGLIPYQHAKLNSGPSRELDFDNYRFITHELFLYAIAAYLKYRRFDAITYLLDREYFIGNVPFQNRDMISFCVFRNYVKSFDWRKQRTGSSRVSLQADAMKDRCKGVAIDFQQIMAADFVCYLSAAIRFRNSFGWYPVTCMYLFDIGGFHRTLELFARAKSRSFFERIKLVFGISNADAFRAEIERLGADYQSLPRWNYEYLDVVNLTNAKEIAMVP